MIARSMLALGTFVLLAQPGPAAACTCSARATPALEYPRAGATDVPLDVVLTTERGDQGRAFVALLDEAGRRIELEPVRSFVRGACDFTVELRRPAEPLAPNTRYALIEDDGTQAGDVHAFTTGTGRMPVRDTVDVALSYYRITRPADCGEACEPTAELRVDRASVLGSGVQLYLSLETGGAAFYVGDVAAGEGDVFYAAAGLAAADACIRYEFFDQRGEVLETGERCDPTRCARDAGLVVGESSCGTDPTPVGDKLWSQVEDGSCAHPPEVRSEGERVIVGSDGCSLSPARSPFRVASVLLVGLALGRRARRRK